MFTQLWNSETVKNLSFLDRNSLTYVCEVGCYEGLTSNHIVKSLLNHVGTLVCIDDLRDDYELDNDNEIFNGQYQRFVENTEEIKDRIWLIRKKSQDILPTLRDNIFDLVFVDGDHTYNSVYADAVEAFRIVKVNGYVLFDDFEWGNVKPVKAAVERFLSENTNYRLLLKLNQVLIQKLEPESKTENGQSRYQAMSIEKLFNKDTIYAAYCNLDSRPDRNEKMIAELERVDLEIPIVRQRSYPWEELYNNFSDEEKLKVDVMVKRKTPGAIGCWFSQMEVMKEALRQGKHAIVLEDDIVVCNDMPQRLKIIFTYLNQHEWDIFWFGGTYHLEPTWHKSVEGRHVHPDLQMCNCLLNRDWEETLHPAIVRTYGAFSTHAYMVNKNRIQHVLDFLDRRMSISMGIDFLMILEQPNLNCYAFNPGCMKQFDGQSNIGDGISRFSGFRSLGNHWFSKSMDKYIPD